MTRDEGRGGAPEIKQCAGGWFVTGDEWSGPWVSEEAAELARDGEYTLAHMMERSVPLPPAPETAEAERVQG